MGGVLPENSLAALREGMVNADGIEFDLRLTKTGTWCSTTTERQ